MTKTILQTLKTGTLKTSAVTAVLLLLVSAPALAAADRDTSLDAVLATRLP